MKKHKVVLRKQHPPVEFNPEIVEIMVRARTEVCPHCAGGKPLRRLVCENCVSRYGRRIQTALEDILAEKSGLLKSGVFGKTWDEVIRIAKVSLAKDEAMPVGRLLEMLEERFPAQDYFAPLSSLIRQVSLLKTLLLKEMAEQEIENTAG